MSEYIVGVEAGGTKFFVVLGTKTGEIKHRVRIKTTIPEETIPQVVEVLQKFYKDPGFEALGVAIHLTSAPDFVKLLTSNGILTAAMLPVTPISTRRPFKGYVSSIFIEGFLIH